MRKKSTLLALSVSALLVLAGCNPSHTSSSESTPVDTPIQTTPVSDTGSDTDTSPTVTVTITSTETEVLTEGTLTLTAEVAGVEDGKLTWAIESKNPETMDASIAADTGVLQAGTVAGTLVVTATCEGVTAKVTITVKEAPVVTTVTILGAPTEAVYTGREVKLDAYVTNGPSGYTVDWSCTSDPADMGATVDANGKVTTGNKPGKITVTATVGDASDSVTITVVEAPVVSIEITNTETEVALGGTLQLNATITNGEDGAKPNWAIASKNPSTMDSTIDAATGLLTAGKIPGKLTVTASYKDASDTIELTVPAPSFGSDVFPASYKMTVGDSYFELVQGKGLISSSSSGTTGYVLVDGVLYTAEHDEKQGYVYRLDQPLDPVMTVEGAFASFDLNSDAAKYVYASTDPTTGNHTYTVNLVDTKAREVAAIFGLDPETAKAVVDPDGDLVSFTFVDEGKDIATTITAVDDLTEDYKAYVGITITGAPSKAPTNDEIPLDLKLVGVDEADIIWSIVKNPTTMDAKIDQDGTLHTGEVAGTVTVRAAAGDYYHEVTIEIQLVTVDIGGVPTEPVLTEQTVELVAKITNTDEKPVWSIETVAKEDGKTMDATIDEDGTLHTGTVGGTITVTLSVAGYSDEVEIVVKQQLSDGGATDEGVTEDW